MIAQSKKEWALLAARRRLPVFPIWGTDDEGNCDCGAPEGECSRGKHPITWDGHKSATLDRKQIEEWWQDNPNANIGVYPGGVSLVVVDLDVKNKDSETDEIVSGITSLMDATGEDIFGLCAETYVVETPSGGLHLYYRPGPNEEYGSSAGHLPGVDSRGVGGYVLGAGSKIGEREYTEVGGSDRVAPLPESIKPILKHRQERDPRHREPVIELDLHDNIVSAIHYLTHLAPPAIQTQHGDLTTFKVACHVKDLGISHGLCLELMWEHYNVDNKCKPTWDLEGLTKKVDSAYRNSNERPGSKGAGLIDMLEEQEGADALPQSELPPMEALERYLRERMFFGSGFRKMETDREYVVYPFVLAHGFNAILAKRGAGKSVAMLDMACRLACDMDWHDCPTQEGLAVVYLCGEDDAGAKVQMEAWCKLHGQEMPEDRFLFMPVVADMRNREVLAVWTRVIREFIGDRKGVVFVDTWQRATAGASQNDDEEMGVAVRNMERFVAALRCTAVVAFHPPKHDSDTITGSFVIENASVSIARIATQGAGRRYTLIRTKGEGTDWYKQFKYEEVSLGRRNNVGIDVTGVIPVVSGGTDVSDPSAPDAEDAAIRKAYAQVAYEMVASNPSRYSGEKGPGVSTVAKWIDAVAKVEKGELSAEDSGYDGITSDVVEGVMSVLRAAGVTHFGENHNKGTMTEKFVNDVSPTYLDNGFIVTVHKTRTSTKLVVERDRMDADNMTVDELASEL